MRPQRIVIPLLALALLAAACGDDDTTDTTGTTGEPGATTTGAPGPAASGDVVASALARTSPDVSADDLAAAAAAERAFAAAVFELLAEGDGNVVFSPASIHLALAMTYAGARGATAAEMADVLGSPFDDQERFHAALNALDAALEARNRVEPPGPSDEERKVVVRTANALWGQQGLTFLTPFLDTLARDYGAGMRLVDYLADAEAARVAINAWVAGETNDRITDLIPAGVLGPMTRLVLTNAVYLDASWAMPFDPKATADGAFVRLDGSEVTVPFMHQEESLPFATGDGWRAVELPYVGGELAMLVVVPDDGRFEETQAAIGGGLFDEAAAALAPATVRLALPKFEYRTQETVSSVLRRLGMATAFDPQSADFSGMTTEERLFIGEVIHEAFIAVDEAGTEAAAATAVVMRATAAPIDAVELTVDRPFLYSLYDRATGAILFMGRVLDPAAS
jgi:serpin B